MSGSEVKNRETYQQSAHGTAKDEDGRFDGKTTDQTGFSHKSEHLP